MTKTYQTIIMIAISACGLFPATAMGQETSHLAFDVQGGFTTTAGRTARRVDTGWNLGLGAGYNFNSRVGALVQFDYISNGINSSTLNNLGFPGGDVHVWDFSLDPIYHFKPTGPVSAYVTGGGGIYHYTREFTAPTVSTVTAFDPFFGFYQAGIPTTQILSSYTVNRPGFNIGAGVGLGSKWHAKFYAEAKWHRMLFPNSHYDMIPVSFGVRF